MPSKKKPARPSPSPSPSPSPRTPRPSTPTAAATTSDESSLRELLSTASAEHPHLISAAAIAATVTSSDASPSAGNRATLYLSDSAVTASPLSNGDLVSVSVAGDGRLDSLAEQCATRFGTDVGAVGGAAGCYFAVATVYASSKVPKNGARLSWGLSCTMGFPDVGRSIFVSPFSGSVSDNRNCNCKQLYLSMVHPKDGLVGRMETIGVQGGNGDIGSPKTPSSVQSRVSASVAGNSEFESRKGSSLCWDNSVARLAMEDDKAKEMLETFAVRWLNRRHLLIRNFVIVPIMGQFCVFQVEGADSLDVSCDTQCLISNKMSGVLACETHISDSMGEIDAALLVDSMGEIDAAFLVDTRTKIHLSDPKSKIQDIPNKCNLSIRGSMCNAVIDKKVGDAPRLGGLSKEFAALKEIITFSLLNKNALLPRYKGVLLYGPPGTGKTSLVSYCVHDAGASLFSINGPEIVSQYFGESEQTLHEVFLSARRAAPSVVFIDELDAIAPARKDGGEELSLRLVATLLKLMDEISRDDSSILVIAATNRPDSIDGALRRHGRLDREIEIGVPSPDQRLDILQTVLSDIDNSLSNTEIQSLASSTHGFVGADLAALCNEAAMTNLRRYIKLKSSDKHFEESCLKPNGFATDVRGFGVYKDEYSSPVEHMDSLLASLTELSVSSSELSVSSKPVSPVNLRTQEEEMLLKVTFEDFENAKMKVRPSAMREVMLELPQIHWEDVGGQTKVKKQLIEAVQWPQINPGAFERVGIRPPRGLLMIGPPGCSKTLMARAVASEAKLNFLAVKGPELFSKWVGESEKAVKSLFAKARVNSPAIIFFDEIDGLAISRGQENDGTSVADRVLSQLLVEMDGLDERLGVTVIGATNRPDKIDDALLRPGRFDRLIDVQPPDQTDREDIFRIHMRNIPCNSDVRTEVLASLTEGYTGADIKLICREAAIAALEESLVISEVSMSHFEAGIRRVQPSDLQFYQNLAAEFKRFVDTGPVRDEVSWLNAS